MGEGGRISVNRVPPCSAEAKKETLGSCGGLTLTEKDADDRCGNTSPCGRGRLRAQEIIQCP
jgi:hypothetical protein